MLLTFKFNNKNNTTLQEFAWQKAAATTKKLNEQNINSTHDSREIIGKNYQILEQRREDQQEKMKHDHFVLYKIEIFSAIVDS